MNKRKSTEVAIYCPFPAYLSPFVDEVGQHTLAWARQLDLITEDNAKKFRTEQHWRLMAYVYPTITCNDLALVTDWNTWGFALDDFLDQADQSHQQILAGIVAIIRGQDAGTVTHPLCQALADIWQRLRRRASKAWCTQLAATLFASFESYLWQKENYRRGEFPARADYLDQRVQTGAWLTYLRFYELFADIPSQPFTTLSPPLQDYLRLVNQTICIANDLVSYPKELAENDPHNLVLIVQHEDRVTLADAVGIVTRYHDTYMRQCQAMADTLVAATDETVAITRDTLRSYITFAEAFLRGNLEWSRETVRYGQPNMTMHALQPTPRQRITFISIGACCGIMVIGSMILYMTKRYR